MPNQIQIFIPVPSLPALHTQPWAPPTPKPTNDIDLSRRTTRVIATALPAPETLRPHLDPHLAARQRPRFRTVITSSNLPTQPDHRLLGRKSASKNTLQRFNVTSAQRSLLVLTIFDPIFALIRTSDLSYAQSVEKLSLVNTIARGTRACTAERRSSCAVVS